jgi:N utilization substance protein B
MVNRRHIRIKVMQSVYALFQSKSDDLAKEVKFLKLSVQKTYELYIHQLLMIIAVRDMHSEHLEIKKGKHLATPEDKDPNLKFVNNQLIKTIESSPEVKNYIQERRLDMWSDNREFVRIILDKLTKQDFFKAYHRNRTNNFREDKDFVIQLFKEIIAPDDKLYDFYESMNLSWVDDIPFVNTMLVKNLKQTDEGKAFRLGRFRLNKDDEEFMVELFEKTALKHTEFDKDIDGKTPNWDNERIAEIDMILIKMALVEFVYFPSIPTKVTINEYIEIAKDYSTQKSSYFINGVIDKLLKEFQEQKRLHKIGRGLL